MNSERTELLLIDDHSLLRRGLAELLNATEDFLVIAQAANGQDGIDLAQALLPELIVLDLHMPGLSGLQTLARLKHSVPDSLVVVLTASDQQDDLLAALRGGADGYLLKDSEPEQLIEHLRGCSKGQVTLDPALAGLLSAGLPPRMHGEAELTERERQTLALIAEGMSNKLIARELGISDGTVKIHVKHLLSKLGLHSRLELAAWAHRGGLSLRAGVER